MRSLAGPAVVILLLGACAVEPPGLQPPGFDPKKPGEAYDLYFPSGVVAHPNGRYAYVVNANTDLRYNAATLSTISLDYVDEHQNFDAYGQRIEGLEDSRNRGAIVSALKIQSYGAQPVLDGAAQRMFVATRQLGVLYSFDMADPAAPSCGEAQSNTSCDAAHSKDITGADFSAAFSVADTAEPWQGAVVAPLEGLPGEFLYLTHMGAGAVTVYDVTPNALTNPHGLAPVALLGADTLGAAVNGTASIAVAAGEGRVPVIYAGANRLLSVRQGTSLSNMLFFFEPKVALGQPGNRGAINLRDYFGGPTMLSDVKYIVTVPPGSHHFPAGSRVYALTRDPNSLLVLDASLDANGVPKNQVIDIVPLERLPSAATYVRAATPDARDLIYVSCYGDGSILMFDAGTLTLAGKLLALRQGPFALTTAYRSGRPFVLATYFTDDQLVMIDAGDADPSRHRLIGTVGSLRGEKGRR